MHRVGSNVAPGEGNARGVTSEREVGRTRDVLVVVFLGILVRTALKAEVERDGIGDEPPEIEVQRVTAESPAFPGEVGNRRVDGDAVAFFEEDSVFAVEREARRVEPEPRGVDSREHGRVAFAGAGHSQGGRVKFRSAEDGGAE